MSPLLGSDDIYHLVEKYFIENVKTIDVGCGNGRDTNWLNSNGFPAIGVDVSESLLTEARRALVLIYA
ncbi:MAG: class I SAM-dependent methyltransferase [Bdellovibrionaceae bacterium]|nr:class I SAM-dependent methyltransferase [Pseudobdellovibrionaceae bacterium]